MSGRSPNDYSRYLSDIRDYHPPTPDSAGSHPSLASGSRSVPRTPGASFTPQPGFSPLLEPGQAPPGVQHPEPLQEVDWMAALQEILGEESHRFLPNLHPHRPAGTYWFDDDDMVATVIGEIFSHDFQEPHANFSQTPVHIIDRWFMSFARRFHWEFSITGMVRKEFEASLKRRMCDHVGRWKNKWRKKGDAAKPQWFQDAVWAGLVRYWEDDKSKKKAELCSKARLSDPEGLGPHKHCSGRTSFKARARMEQEASGDSHPDLVKTLHNTKRNKSGVFMDKKAERLYNDVTAKLQQLSQCSGEESSASGGLSTAQRNQVYADLAPRKKGRVYGTGSLGTMIDQCISQEGFSQSSRSSDQELREIVDRQTQVIEHTTDELARAKKKLSTYDRLWSIMAKKDPELAAAFADLTEEEPGSGSGNADQSEES